MHELMDECVENELANENVTTESIGKQRMMRAGAPGRGFGFQDSGVDGAGASGVDWMKGWCSGVSCLGAPGGSSRHSG